MVVDIRIENIAGDCLRGWAIDRDEPDTPVELELLADGIVLGSVTAKILRNDIASKGLSQGYSGFRFPLPARLLGGLSVAFSARAKAASGRTDEISRVLFTPRWPFSHWQEKPWLETGIGVSAPIAQVGESFGEVLELFESGRIDDAIGLARVWFRRDRGLFAIDTGIVEAVSQHVGIKSFEQIMSDRHRDWFRAKNPSIWQRRLASKAEMQRFGWRNQVGTPHQIASFSRPEDLLEIDLPTRYVAKPDGLASRKGVFAVSDGYNAFTGMPTAAEDIVKAWSAIVADRERSVSFIVEEFVTDRFAPGLNAIPLDYKVYVFGGVAGFLEVFDRNNPAPARSPYSIDWHPLPEPLEVKSTLGPAIRRPDNLEEIVQVAERLGSDLGAFCRVDLFNGANGPVLGEVTVLPANGRNRTAYANRITQQAYIVFEDQQLWQASV